MQKADVLNASSHLSIILYPEITIQRDRHAENKQLIFDVHKRIMQTNESQINKETSLLLITWLLVLSDIVHTQPFDSRSYGVYFPKVCTFQPTQEDNNFTFVILINLDATLQPNVYIFITHTLSTLVTIDCIQWCLREKFRQFWMKKKMKLYNVNYTFSDHKTRLKIYWHYTVTFEKNSQT